MSAKKLIVLTALVVALFAFVFLFERKMPTTAERQQKGDLVWDLPEERIESVRLERPGRSWSSRAAARAPGDSSGRNRIRRTASPLRTSSRSSRDLKRAGSDASEATPGRLRL